MKVLLSTGSLYHMGLHRIFSIVKEAGFKYVELMMRSIEDNAYIDSFDIEYLKKLEKEFGLKIASLHFPIDFESKAEFYYPMVLKQAQELGVDHIIFHIPKDKDCQRDYRLWFEKVYRKELQKNQPIPFLTENMGPHCIEKGADKFNSYQGFCFDTAHEMSTGTDYLGTLRQMHNIRQFHLSYFDGADCHLSILKDTELFKEIISLHPEAYRCLELSPKAFSNLTDDKQIARELREMREFLESI